jgi:hypothetical protein
MFSQMRLVSYKSPKGKDNDREENDHHVLVHADGIMFTRRQLSSHSHSQP